MTMPERPGRDRFTVVPSEEPDSTAAENTPVADVSAEGDVGSPAPTAEPAASTTQAAGIGPGQIRPGQTPRGPARPAAAGGGARGPMGRGPRAGMGGPAGGPAGEGAGPGTPGAGRGPEGQARRANGAGAGPLMQRLAVQRQPDETGGEPSGASLPAVRRQGDAVQRAQGRNLQPLGTRRRVNRRPQIDLDELWAPVKVDRAPVDREFLPGALEIIEAPASPARIAVIYAICGLLAAALIWSWFGHLDVYADATGKIQASGRTKVVQPTEAGRVVSIRATDGDKVKAGDVLVELDPAEAQASRNIIADSLNNARAEVARRNAAIAAAGKTPVDTRPKVAWPADLPQTVTEREEQALRSDLTSLAATVANLSAQKDAKLAEIKKYEGAIGPQKAVLDLIKEHVGMKDTLFKDGWNSRATVIQLLQQQEAARLELANLQGSLDLAKAAVPVIDSDIAKAIQAFVTSNTQSLVTAQQKVDEQRQSLAKADVKLTNMTIRAPIAGTVQATAVTTVGQVLSTGQQIMQVVPEGTPIEIEAYVLNTDAGFIREGQEATIKVDTFPYTRYGTIPGKVVKVATDALTGKQAQNTQKNGSQPTGPDGQMSITSAAQQTSDLVFPVTVQPLKTTVTVGGREVPLSSGMTVTVEIKTESRRAIDYILSPLQATLSQAAQER